MNSRLYSLCQMMDGVHWLIIGRDGQIFECSPYGFASEGDALLDLKRRLY